MEDYDLAHDHQYQSALATMCVADPDRSEEILKQYFGAGSSAWDAWDEQFLTFIEAHRKPGLFYGTIGNGWHFLFCAADQKGIWVFSDQGMKGKGFLRPESIAALTEVAYQKELLRR
jgi:hypothetical protein